MTHKYLKTLAECLCGIHQPERMTRFLSEILTPTELENIVLRWRIFHLLFEGVSQREISQLLGVSLCKITRGARELKRPKSLVKHLLQKESSPKNPSKKSENLK